MRRVLALVACISAFTLAGVAQSRTPRASNPSQKVVEQTVVLSVRGMT
jgi:hypothetical protein